MTEPLKNLFSEEVIRGMATELARVDRTFDPIGFVNYSIDGLDRLELKQRSSRLTDALERFLPEDFVSAVRVLVESLDSRTDWDISEMSESLGSDGLAGWAVMPMADYVARHGLGQIDVSLDALREMTMRSSSEFAIRSFLEHREEATLSAMRLWGAHENQHVRRLVSEGSRPRLPWGKQLRRFVDDPGPVIELLESLKDDPSEYVRRSVANNLNDIAKDHPDLVVEIADRWMVDASAERQGLVRHALRTLVKSGHRGALKTLGYGRAATAVERFEVLTPEVTLGGALEFEVELVSEADSDQALMIDFVVHHMKASGETSPKVFKWKKATLAGRGGLVAAKRHPMRPITTRKYYSGHHQVDLQVNGNVLASANFTLIVPAKRANGV